jgi:hypothetical protein
MNKTIYEFCITLSRPKCTWLDSRLFMIGVLYYVVSDFMSHFLVPPPIKRWGHGVTKFYSTQVSKPILQAKSLGERIDRTLRTVKLTALSWDNFRSMGQ